jgi:hypothetical protein
MFTPGAVTSGWKSTQNISWFLVLRNGQENMAANCIYNPKPHMYNIYEITERNLHNKHCKKVQQQWQTVVRSS